MKKISLLVLLTVLYSCGLVTKKYETPKLSSEQESNLYRDYQSSDTNNIAAVEWRSFFADPQLVALIQKGIDNNYDLRNAVLQMGVAENHLRQAKLGFLPSLNFAPQVTFNKQSKNSVNLPANVNINLQTTNVSLGFTSAWEVEIWGKLSAAKRGAQASLFQTEATKRAVQTNLIASIANAYYTLLSLDKQLEITEQTIELREKTVVALNALLGAGNVNGADVVQAEANLSAAKVTVPDLKRAIREMENYLCILTAQPLQAIERGKLDATLTNTPLMAGVPAQLLGNRPDVMVAEANFRQAFEAQNVAKASMFPTLTLTAGSAGISALTTKTLFDPLSLFANLVGGLTQPIFQRGQLKANYRNSIIAKEQAFNQYQNTLLVAGQEVTDALFAYQMISEKQQERLIQIEALNKAVNFRMELLKFSSTTNYTDVLTSEQGLLTAELAGVNDQLQAHQSVIELYRALGGGWK